MSALHILFVVRKDRCNFGEEQGENTWKRNTVAAFIRHPLPLDSGNLPRTRLSRASPEQHLFDFRFALLTSLCSMNIGESQPQEGDDVS
jgi:hypothetical protein